MSRKALTPINVTVPTGTAPFTISSTTKVTNLNADLLDDQEGSYYTNASNLGSGTVPTARLGSGSATSSTVLAGDSTWKTVASALGYTPVNKAGDTGLGGNLTWSAGAYRLAGTDGTTTLFEIWANGGTAGAALSLYGYSHSTYPGNFYLMAQSVAGTAILSGTPAGVLNWKTVDIANSSGLIAGALGSGTVPTARLGSGTANSSSFLRGDGTWASSTTSSFSAQGVSQGAVSINSGSVANPGYLAIFSPEGTRRGYIGWKSGSYDLWQIVSENNWGVEFNTYGYWASGTLGIGTLYTSTAQLSLAASTTGVASLNVAHGTAPTSPVNGDIWTTSSGVYARINGTTVGPLASTSPVTAIPCDFRLTLTSGNPATTADVTAATTVYMTPIVGNRIALYDGAVWNIRTTAQISVSVPATTNTPFDVFCYDNSGTPTLETVNWTNDTTRATALTTQDGVYVKSGATTRRYIGTCRTTGSSGQTEDSFAKRFVWSYYNRVIKAMRRLESTASWNYTTATWRQANNAAANQLDFVIGVDEDEVRATATALVSNTGVNSGYVGIGLDSTSALATGCMATYLQVQVANQFVTGSSHLDTFPGVGRHYLAWLERSDGSGTMTWYGFSSGLYAYGITGSLRC